MLLGCHKLKAFCKGKKNYIKKYLYYMSEEVNKLSELTEICGNLCHVNTVTETLQQRLTESCYFFYFHGN